MSVQPLIEHISDGCTCLGKFCRGCQHVLCVDTFTHDSHASDGLYYRCKRCNKAYYKANREKILARSKAYVNAHKEKHQEYIRFYSATDRAKELNQKRGKAFRKAHELELPSRKKAYYEANKDRILAQERVKNAANPGRKRTYKQSQHYKMKAKRYKEANVARYQAYAVSAKANRRSRILGIGGKVTSREWRRLKAHYNYTCLRCRKREPDIKLCADHVIPLSLGGSNTINNIQPLCVSCNSIKRTKTTDYRIGERGESR